jgi:hypothetical protein
MWGTLSDDSTGLLLGLANTYFVGSEPRGTISQPAKLVPVFTSPRSMVGRLYKFKFKLYCD